MAYVETGLVLVLAVWGLVLLFYPYKANREVYEACEQWPWFWPKRLKN